MKVKEVFTWQYKGHRRHPPFSGTKSEAWGIANQIGQAIYKTYKKEQSYWQGLVPYGPRPISDSCGSTKIAGILHCDTFGIEQKHIVKCI